ncbi:MAG: HYR domain-containing protein, partial [Bacteroidota bacterium]
MAQSTNDGPIRLEVRTAQVYARDYDDTFGGITNAENTWKTWARDQANLDGQDWRGGQCIQFNIGSGSFPFTSGNLGTVLMDQTYAVTVPTSFQLRMDAWEDDCGNRCDFDGDGSIFGPCLGDADDNRCNLSNYSGNINFRANPPGQWNSHGFFFLCGGDYGVRSESRWRYTQGNSFSSPYVLGTANCDPETFTHFNNTSTYTNSGGSPRASKDIYYVFTIGQTSNVTISTCNAGSNFDTYLYLLNSGNGVIAQNDDFGGCSFSSVRSQITQNNLAPGTYYIAVEAFGSTQEGLVDLSVNIQPNAQTVAINGLPTDVCLNNGNVSMTGTPSGGTFSGPGVSGSSFNPAAAGVGTHTVTYTVTGPGFTNYTAQQIGFNAITGGGTTISLGDDVVSGGLPLGFNFEFYGNVYNTAFMSSNGFLTFNSGSPNGCCSGQALPNGAAPNNLIAAAWEDLDPGNGLSGDGRNRIWYTTVGAAPNREFRITFWRVDHHVSGNLVTFRIRLFETSNVIEIHTLSMPSDGGSHTMGIENANGTLASVVPGRNASNWSTSNNAWRFTPPNACGGSVSHQVTVNPLPNAAFTVPGTVCGNESVTLVPAVAGGTFSGPGVSGNNFNAATAGVGSHTITYSITDNNGCTNSSSQTVTVEAAPTATATGTDEVCPGANDGTATAGPAGQSYMWNTGATSQTITGLAPGNYVVTVTNSNGCTDIASVTVAAGVDNTNPTISCPSNLTSSNDAGQCGAALSWMVPSANDNCGTPTVSSTANPGDFFNVGNTTVTYTATDGSGNSANCSFTVTVTDNENPTISCPSNITQNNDAGQCNAVVSYMSPSGMDNCPGAVTALTAGSSSGSIFPVGTTTNTFTVTDAAGNTASCSFSVTVVDAEVPSITCPANITVNNDPGQCSAVVTYTAPSGTDNCPGATTALTSGLGSGGTFPQGTSSESYTVTDAAGNTASCNFTVTVNDDEAPTITCPANTTLSLDVACEATVPDFTSNPFTAADADVEFDSNQGHEHWQYGEYFAFSSNNFAELPNYNGTRWEGTQAFATPFMDAFGGHPGVNDLKWAVRRWRADMTGTVTISGLFFDRDLNCGDGANVRIFQNGTQVYDYLNVCCMPPCSAGWQRASVLRRSQYTPHAVGAAYSSTDACCN